ncbi:hypothetical protein B0H13DRAFT_2349336 [Mycena leptocephala]|nr:hypothetical protein B0H13DRAFT_2349336 [Mycena leptocephala]
MTHSPPTGRRSACSTPNRLPPSTYPPWLPLMLALGLYAPPARSGAPGPAGRKKVPIAAIPLSRYPLSPSVSPFASPSTSLSMGAGAIRREGWCPRSETRTSTRFGAPADAVRVAISRGTAGRARASGGDKCPYPGCDKKYHRARALFSLVCVRRWRAVLVLVSSSFSRTASLQHSA